MPSIIAEPAPDVLEQCATAPASDYDRQRIAAVTAANPDFDSIQVWAVLADEGRLIPLTQVIGAMQGL
jgi:hypothetical protein